MFITFGSTVIRCLLNLVAIHLRLVHTTHARARALTHTHTHTHTCMRAHTRIRAYKQEHKILYICYLQIGADNHQILTSIIATTQKAIYVIRYASIWQTRQKQTDQCSKVIHLSDKRLRDLWSIWSISPFLKQRLKVLCYSLGCILLWNITWSFWNQTNLKQLNLGWNLLAGFGSSSALCLSWKVLSRIYKNRQLQFQSLELLLSVVSLKQTYLMNDQLLSIDSLCREACCHAASCSSWLHNLRQQQKNQKSEGLQVWSLKTTNTCLPVFMWKLWWSKFK